MKRKWTAYHEAGHSVAAAVLDILRSDKASLQMAGANMAS
jgi:hypothetical protein